MGGWMSFLWGSKPVRILILGLDASGKTTLLYRMKLGEVVKTVPSVGFNVEQLEMQNATLMAWDVGGRSAMKPLWHHYYPNTQGAIYLVDSTDRERLDEAAEYLAELMANEELLGVPFLVAANKQDAADAIPLDEIRQRLNLAEIGKGRRWMLAALHTTATELQQSGVKEAFEWLAAAVRSDLNSKTLEEAAQALVDASNRIIASFRGSTAPNEVPA